MHAHMQAYKQMRKHVCTHTLRQADRQTDRQMDTETMGVMTCRASAVHARSSAAPSSAGTDPAHVRFVSTSLARARCGGAPGEAAVAPACACLSRLPIKPRSCWRRACCRPRARAFPAPLIRSVGIPLPSLTCRRPHRPLPAAIWCGPSWVPSPVTPRPMIWKGERWELLPSAPKNATAPAIPSRHAAHTIAALTAMFSTGN